MNKNIKYAAIALVTAAVGFGGWVANNHRIAAEAVDERAFYNKVQKPCFDSMHGLVKTYDEDGNQKRATNFQSIAVCSLLESEEEWLEHREEILFGTAHVDNPSNPKRIIYK